MNDPKYMTSTCTRDNLAAKAQRQLFLLRSSTVEIVNINGTKRAFAEPKGIKKPTMYYAFRA